MENGLEVLMIFDASGTRHIIMYVYGTERLKIWSYKDGIGVAKSKSKWKLENLITPTVIWLYYILFWYLSDYSVG